MSKLGIVITWPLLFFMILAWRLKKRTYFHGERFELEIAASLIRKKLLISKQESPDFKIEYKENELFIECGSARVREKNRLFAQFGKLISKADLYNPLPHDDEVLEYQYGIYQSVWEDAKILRRSGKLLELGKQIKCPVVAIHGDYDPHPPEGIKIPLSSILVDFKFVLIKDCGHYPWVERKARSRFYSILKSELD